LECVETLSKQSKTPIQKSQQSTFTKQIQCNENCNDNNNNNNPHNATVMMHSFRFQTRQQQLTTKLESIFPILKSQLMNFNNSDNDDDCFGNEIFSIMLIRRQSKTLSTSQHLIKNDTIWIGIDQSTDVRNDSFIEKLIQRIESIVQKSKQQSTEQGRRRRYAPDLDQLFHRVAPRFQLEINDSITIINDALLLIVDLSIITSASTTTPTTTMPKQLICANDSSHFVALKCDIITPSIHTRGIANHSNIWLFDW
jgi:hypothetical protein